MDARTLCILCAASFFVEALTEAPQIVPSKIDDDLEEGQRLRIICSIRKGSLPISFSWRKNNLPIVPTAGATIQHIDDYQEQLEVGKLSPKHVGNYTCSVKNLHGSDQITIPVSMKYPPRWVINDDGKTVNGIAGGNAILDCSAKGHPTPSITIRKGERLE